MQSRFFISGLLFTFTSLIFLTSTIRHNDDNLHHEGMYIGKTMEITIGDKTIETYNYLRFYEDGTVICQSVSGYDPASVGLWFHTGEGGKYERKGQYQLNGKELFFEVNNDGTPDKELEGPRVDSYRGEIVNSNAINLKLTYSGGTETESTYAFVFDKE